MKIARTVAQGRIGRPALGRYAAWAAMAIGVMAWPIGPVGAQSFRLETMQVAVDVEPPSGESVLRAMQELVSLRDYERLGWILKAIDRQPAPLRAQPLSQLDQRMERLIRSEVASRVLSVRPNVLASTSLLEERPGGSALQEARSNAPSRPSADLRGTTDRGRIMMWSSTPVEGVPPVSPGSTARAAARKP